MINKDTILLGEAYQLIRETHSIDDEILYSDKFNPNFKSAYEHLKHYGFRILNREPYTNSQGIEVYQMTNVNLTNPSNHLKEIELSVNDGQVVTDDGHLVDVRRYLGDD